MVLAPIQIRNPNPVFRPDPDMRTRIDYTKAFLQPMRRPDASSTDLRSSLFGSAFYFAHGGGEGGHYFKEIAYDAVVGYFKDGGVLVFVDGYVALRAFHSDEVLDGSADADGDVDLGGYGLA